MCHFLFLPASCHTPPLRGEGGVGGDTRVFAREGGNLVVPTAPACPGTGLVRVAAQIEASKVLKAWRVLCEPRSASPYRPPQAVKGNAGKGGRQPASQTPSSEGCARGHLCPIRMCASSSVSRVPVCVLE